MAKAKTENTASAQGQCLCGAVQFEIGIPARWAWHDHSAASRRAHGAAYATYVVNAAQFLLKLRAARRDEAMAAATAAAAREGAWTPA